MKTLLIHILGILIVLIAAFGLTSVIQASGLINWFLN